MNVLRFVLLALSIVTMGALAWRLGREPHYPAQDHPAQIFPAQVAAITPPPQAVPTVVAPSAPATVPAPAPAVATPAPPLPPAATATPQPSAPRQTGERAAPAVAAAQPATGLTAVDASKAIEASLRTAPDLARVFDALRAQFPAVADRTLAVAAETMRSSGETPSPDDFIAAAMRELRSSSGVLAAHAGSDALGAIFDAKAATLADLEAADPRICADYLFGGTSPEFGDFVVGHRALVARSALTMIAAMADGRARQINWDMPSPDDYQRIEKALAAKGLSAGEIAALLDGKSLEPPPSDTRLCDNTRAYLDVMRSMPTDARNRVYGLAAELLARS